MARETSASSIAALVPTLTFLAAIAIIYFAKDVLVPLALAVLLAFLLTPMVKRLERWRMGRVPAVLIVLTIALTCIGGIGWIVANQLLDVVNSLPNYKDNIHRKLEAIHGPRGGSLGKVTDSVQELSKELSTTTPKEPPPPALRRPAKTATKAPPLPTGEQPTPVTVIEPPTNALQSLRNVAGPLVGPIGTAGVVIVLAIFLLMKKEDVRNRVLRLAGQSQLNTMTQALSDAAQRVSRYLLMQFVVNATFGTVIAGGLYVIGIPNALLWGVLAGVFRFVPYAGILISSALPLLLSLAVFDGWKQPLMTLGLFLVVELIVANVVEPWLYGAHTGVSSLAILVAAVFWTVLWGPVGLILSTPLTVCLLVLGRYVPQLEFLHILLGDEPVLAPEAQLYQRLLAMDQNESWSVIDAYLKENTLAELYDKVMIPALSMAEEDRHRGTLDAKREAFLMQSVSELVVELADYPDVAFELEENTNHRDRASYPNANSAADSPVVCLPANDQADEITAAMLAQILEREGYSVLSLPASDSALDALQHGPDHGSYIVCISALPPFALLSARALAKRVRSQFPQLKIVVCLWNLTESSKAQDRLGRAFADTVVTTLKQALEQIDALTRGTDSLESDSSGTLHTAAQVKQA